MTDLIDTLTGAQDAVVKLIRDFLPADRRAIVRHSLKQDTKPPFHLIGDISMSDAGSKSDQLDDGEVDVHTVYRGTDRRELLAMMHEVRVATHGQLITIDGGEYRVQWASAAAGSAASTDGVTFAGVTTLTLNAEPA